MEKLLTTVEVAELLGTTPGSLRNARARGLAPRAIRLKGLGLRWRQSDVEAWVAEQAAAAEAR
ncbi:helix-turn-helix transcriptional regulator [Nannocystis punicea]|uniref:helix-turn-helix transcriptional regulator n=1 Tax=Nannocystis punicea TaxID=2995304 RepID=UPI00353059F4